MKPTSSKFASAWLQDTIYTNAKVICEFGSNRFNDGQIVTASSTKPSYRGMAPNTFSETFEFWRKEDVFNNKNYNTMKWLVCDHGAKLTETEDGTGYRAINSDAEEDYERGWWGNQVSMPDGTWIGGPEWVQSEWYEDTIYTSQDTADHSELPTLEPSKAQDRQSAYIQNVPSQEPHNPYGRRVNKFSLYLTEGYENMLEVTTEYKNEDEDWVVIEANRVLDEDEYLVEWEHDEDILVYGLKVTVDRTRSAGDRARISEFNAYYIKDISEDVISFTVDDTREEYDRTVPIGSVGANTFNIELDNTQGSYNLDAEDSVFAPYLGSNNRFEVYVGVDINADPDDPEYEYLQMGEFWSDEWSSDSESTTTSVACRDFSKFLQDENGLEIGHIWTNTNIQAVFTNLLLRKGLHIDRINIDDTFLRGYQMLYLEDSTTWDFFTEVTLVDQGVFGFDFQGNFYYWSYNKLELAPFTSPQADFDWEDNLISGTVRTEIYANSITVKVSGVNLSETGTRALWSPESPTILQWAKMDGPIGVSDTEIKVKQAPRQANGNLTDNNWPFDGGYLWLPEFDDGGECIGGEMIKYKQRTDSAFKVCERGYRGTIAKEWPDGSYIGGARYWDAEFSNSPALRVSTPFVTAIYSLKYTIPEEGKPQAHIIDFDYNAFGAKLAIGNLVDYSTWLVGTGQTMRDIDDTDSNDTISFVTHIPGIVVTEKEGKDSVSEDIEDPLATNSDLIRRYGKNSLEIESTWIQTRNHAQDIANIMTEEFKHPRKIIDIEGLFNPALSSSDRVKISNFPQLSIIDKEYHIMSVSYTYDGGLLASATFREVKI